MNRILVPTDFSKAAAHALTYANKLAGRLGAQIVLLHCSQEPNPTPAQLEDNKQKLRTLAERSRYQQPVRQEGRRIRYEFVSAKGCLQNQVLKLAQALPPDLIVMPLEFSDCEPAQFPGSHAASLMRVVNCPVLLVPKEANPKTVSKLVFATDFTDQDPEVQHQIRKFASAFQAELSVVHVYGKQQRPELHNLKLAMQAFVKNLDFPNLSTHLVEEDDLLEGISDFAEKQQAEMLILATRDNYLTRNLFDIRYTKTKAYHTRIPVLTFYQQKQKPCSGCCVECNEAVTEVPAHQSIALP